MILDRGICSVYSVKRKVASGKAPVYELTLKYESWYAELDFATAPISTGMQEAVEASARIRIVQNRTVQNQDVVVIGGVRYEITRAYHGTDKENGQPLTDLTLKRVVTGEYVIA